MKSKLTLLAATLFAAAAFAVPAGGATEPDSRSIISAEAEITEGLEIDGETYTLFTDLSITNAEWDVDVDVGAVLALTITNGGVLSLGSYACAVDGNVSVTISDSSYLVSNSTIISISDDSSAVITGDGTGTFTVNGDVTISFDSDYLADLVAGTATEYTYQIFDSAVLSNSSFSGDVTVDDSWQDTDGIASVSYDESAGTVTVTIAVPEPSAFGIFAGIAALAFVAARRSRKIA